jgi:hypothetical protein
MFFKDPESLQWRTFVQTLGKGSKSKYEKTIINFKSYHAKVMETCPAWTMEEVFLSYMTLLCNPNMENNPALGWFPMVNGYIELIHSHIAPLQTHELMINISFR